jgi:hypothetical protein
MIVLDETDLLGFFEVRPEPAPQVEREFFWDQLVKTVGPLTLPIGFDTRCGSLAFELSVSGQDGRLLSLPASDIESASIERDANGRKWLRAQSPRATVLLSLAPIITVTIGQEL